ncbi:MAG: dephospho-CoA kinase [Chitinispirillia bacterium]|nr:dephospho-CoA kinase [Chitinispirillia bacterium]MCL2268939.1 dephospho-CoA kinase [Chitinispirillia bacterium]
MADVTRIGIAGYMGAGKSTCARLFESGDTLIINADDEAKRVMLGDRRVVDNLRSVFGGGVVWDDGALRFDVLGRIVFQSIESLSAFNSIVHPPVLEHLERLVAGCTKPLCILDAALIPLWAGVRGKDIRLDRYIWIDTPFDVRLERIKAKRGGIDADELVRRMRLQEEIMPVPQGDHWVRLTDAGCREYIVNHHHLPPPPGLP